MTDTLNGVKAKAMATALGEAGSVNGLEKKYWEHILAGGGSGGGGGVDPALEAKVNKNTADIATNTADLASTTAITSGNTREIEDLANNKADKSNVYARDQLYIKSDLYTKPQSDGRFVTKSGDTMTGDLIVRGEVSPTSLEVLKPSSMGLNLDGETSSAHITPVKADGNLDLANKLSFHGGAVNAWVARYLETSEKLVARNELDVQAQDEHGLRVSTDATGIYLTPLLANGVVDKDHEVKYDVSTKVWAVKDDPLILKSQLDALAARVTALETAARNLNPSPTSGFNPNTVKLTGGFSDDISDEVHISTHKVGSPITIHKADDTAMHAVILLDPTDAAHVSGITIDGGLPTQWDSHAVTWKDGTQHVAFMSPYKFTKQSLEIGINWK